MIDLGFLGYISFDWAFWSSFFSIVLVNIILSGDNAVVIAMAVRNLPKELRKKGILYGAGAAVLLRIVFTFFVAQLLAMSYVKLVGGAVILWIAIKLFVEDEEGGEGSHLETTTVWSAVRLILIADITMALDNMLAVAACSQGNLFLLIIGLGLSIPLVVFTSSLLTTLMDKYPIIIYIGAAILGKVGGEMMITDQVVKQFIPVNDVVIYSVEAFFAVAVIIAGKLYLKWTALKKERKSVPLTIGDDHP